jgi:hypothetical protein
MAELDSRTGWLLAIPGLVLKRMVLLHVPPGRQEAWLKEQGIGFRDARAALNRLTVEQLIHLINAFPEELPDAVVKAGFKEYRHGRSPTLHLYTVPPVALEGLDRNESNRRARRANLLANRALEMMTEQEGMPPRLQELQVEQFQVMEDWPDGWHAGYCVQSRLDYIATDERAVSAYQLLYGHIWIDPGRAFVALHVHPSRLETILRGFLAQVLDAPLVAVRIDKELKRDLRFLQRASCRRARLVDPTPDRQRFRSITLADDEDLARRRYLNWDYQQWENDFPEVASARYYATFLQSREKPLSLSIGLRRGSLTLSGAVAASDLRGWARDTGAQIVDVWRARERRFLEAAPAALDHERLWQHPLLEDFPDDLRRLVLALIQALATIKGRQDPLFNRWPLSMREADLALSVAGREARALLGAASRAAGLVPWFQAVVYVDCDEEDCPTTTDFLVCPSCGRNLFTLSLSDRNDPILACANTRCPDRWQGAFPLQARCEEGHPIALTWQVMADGEMELFLGPELAFLIQELLKGEADVYHFQAGQESAWVRDGMLVHRAVSPAYEIRKAGDRLSINSAGGTVIVGPVSVNGGDFIGGARTEVLSRTAA